MSNQTTPLFDTRTLGKRAQRIRQDKNLSIEALAKLANVNKNTVVRFEKGISTRMETIYKICNILEVSPFELVEGKLVDGRDYAIQKHVSNGSANQTKSKKVGRKDRLQIETYHGIDVGDLNFQLPDGQMNAKVLEIKNAGELHTHSGEEFLFCLTGTIGVRISDVLNKGDAIFFWGTEPHLYFNADEQKDLSVGLSVICGAE